MRALGIRTGERVGAAWGQEPKANIGGAGPDVKDSPLSATGQVGPKLKTSFPVPLTGGDAGSARGRKMESTPRLLTAPSSPALTASPVPT